MQQSGTAQFAGTLVEEQACGRPLVDNSAVNPDLEQAPRGDLGELHPKRVDQEVGTCIDVKNMLDKEEKIKENERTRTKGVVRQATREHPCPSG
jgi:hypothetical protein